MKKILKTCIFWYVLLIMAFTLFNYIAAALPKTKRFQKMTEKSSSLLMAGKEYYNLGPSVMDNFSDAIILSTAYCLKTEQPFSSSILMVHYDNGDWSHKVRSLDQLLKHGPAGMIRECYWRYWHGQSAVLSFLLYFFDLQKIYAMAGALTLLLVMLTGALVYRKYGWIPTFALFFTASLCNFQVFFQSLQFYPVLWIGFGGLLFFLLRPSCSRVSLFFIIGMLCAFFDLLTVPILTFGIPGMIICPEDTQSCIKNGILTWKKWCSIWILYPLLWGIGYSLSWGTKMIYGLLLTGDFRVLFGAIFSRSSSLAGPEEKISRFAVLHKNVTILYDSERILFLLFLLLLGSLFVIQMIRWLRKKTFFRGPVFAGCCIMACFPLLIMSFLANHAFLHAWMTYRGMAVSAASLLMALTAFCPIQPEKMIRSADEK